MKRLPVLVARSICLMTAVGGCGGEEEAAVEEQSSELVALVRPPGLVMGLQHNQNQTPAGTIMFSALQSEATHRRGGDLGAPNHRGYEWWSLPDTGGDPASLKLPPGVVVALKHNVTQAGQSIKAFGRDATVNGDFTNFKRQIGGDRGASAGQGYFWYESTGAGFTDWASIDTLLPKFTVVGLKHSMNQPSKTFVWNGVTFDPVKVSPVPAGFKRVVGGDQGAPNGQGYFWYEKQTGSEIVVQPTLTITLPRSIHMQFGDAGNLDKDGDCLDDNIESFLAQQLRPFVTFDSHETARQSFEPVTVFRIYKTSATTLHIRWAFLFTNDGGYGPGASSACGDSHPGDNDAMDYDLSSTDGGVQWKLTNVRLSFRGLNFPGNSRLEVFDKTFPVVYMSGSKHHEYFNTDNDLHDSLYGNFIGCDDNIDGKGASLLVSPASFAGLSSNNVGEPGMHPPSRFVDVMSIFQNHTIWGGDPFFSGAAGSNLFKFDGTDQSAPIPPADNTCVPTGCAHSVCAEGSPLQPTCSTDAQQICTFDPFCCNNMWDVFCTRAVPSGCN